MRWLKGVVGICGTVEKSSLLKIEFCLQVGQCLKECPTHLIVQGKYNVLILKSWCWVESECRRNTKAALFSELLYISNGNLRQPKIKAAHSRFWTASMWELWTALTNPIGRSTNLVTTLKSIVHLLECWRRFFLLYLPLLSEGYSTYQIKKKKKKTLQPVMDFEPSVLELWNIHYP